MLKAGAHCFEPTLARRCCVAPRDSASLQCQHRARCARLLGAADNVRVCGHKAGVRRFEPTLARRCCVVPLASASLLCSCRARCALLSETVGRARICGRKARAHLTLFAELCALANLFLVHADPVAIERGSALVVKKVAFRDLLWKLFEDDVIFGELTEHHWSDAGEACLPDDEDQGLAEPRVAAASNRKAKKRERTRVCRNRKRARMQEELQTSLKINVLKKFPAHITRVALETGFHAMDAPVTMPGWVGQSLSKLPSRVYTLDELTQTFNLWLIPWKGRYVTLALYLPQLSPAF